MILEEKVLIVKYGEIALRGNNRKLFVKQLISAIRKNLDKIGDYYVLREQGRLIVRDMNGELDYDTVIPNVICVFGVIDVCPGIRTENQDMQVLKQLALKHLKEHHDTEKTFKVETKRSDKRYPLTSREVSAEIGEYILDNYDGLTVDVHNPDLKLWIELRNDAYIYSKVIRAFGGLPVGSSGKATALLSGGIDSPVAAWLIAKRGVLVNGVYFHTPPYTSERAKQKVKDLAEVVSKYTGEFKLFVVPFTDVQLFLLENVPEDKLTIFLKRAMMRSAEIIAYKENSTGLITGDSVGQVASQTMEGLNAINAVCTMPVLRPLSGLDKQEIVDIAKKIGTFDISVRPYEDCCTVFVAKHPETKPKTSVIDKIESKIYDELIKLIEEASENAEVIEF